MLQGHIFPSLITVVAIALSASPGMATVAATAQTQTLESTETLATIGSSSGCDPYNDPSSCRSS